MKFKHNLPYSDPTILDECNLDEETRTVLLSQIQRKLQSQAVKIRADIEVSCFEYEGIDAVKSSLREGIAQSTQEIPIRINLIAPPLYGKHNFFYNVLIVCVYVHRY